MSRTPGVWLAILLYATQSLGAEPDELQRLLFEERAHPSVLTYSQSYVTSKNEPVTYTGTLFLVIDSVHMQACHLTVHVSAEDRFAGLLDRRRRLGGTERVPTKPEQDTYSYTYSLDLRRLLQSDIGSVDGRPEQFEDSRSLRCEENAACSLRLLRVRSALAGIEERRELNGFVDLKGIAPEVLIPVSSEAALITIQASMKAAIEACR